MAMARPMPRPAPVTIATLPATMLGTHHLSVVMPAKAGIQ
jgi:hypothetical protein